jgi:hypothetical protein
VSSRLPAATRLLGRGVAAAALAAALVVGPALVSVVQAATWSTPAARTVPPLPDPETIGSNPFIPDDANIGDCVSALPRPDCGTDQRGGYHQYVTLLVLALATVFIGWRIARGVRARDRVINDVPDKTSPPSKV